MLLTQKMKDTEKINKIKNSSKEEKVDTECVHYFGYLSKRSKNSPIPHECIICSRLGSCMVATVYLKK